ncbi:MAG TPA: transcriptional regulator [Candidatus Bathyarchaeia archaeon]|nr:transcriptional regulator [Candidatus Bathyarchaeia archaeon]
MVKTATAAIEKNQAKLLEKIKECLDKLNEKMEVFIELQKNEQKEDVMKLPGLPEALDVMTLLSLPDHLRKSAISLCKLGEATAEEVAENTRRARAVESGYLNQLVIMGYLKKERRGRKTFFYVEKQ